MPGSLLGAPHRSRVATLVVALTALGAAGPDARAARSTVVDTGQAQCCSSIVPQKPPATYYGATMLRADDFLAAARPLVAPMEDPPGSIDDLERLVDETEARGGAVTMDLVEPLRGLAAAYFAAGRYPQGLAALRRGIHVTRMNNGLHSTKQVPLIEQLIAAHVRLGDYVEADAQQDYLYHVLSYRRDHSAPELRAATLRYADWMRGAYIGDLDRQRFPRLVGINDLYEAAIEEIEASEGEDSRELLPYLEGRAQLSYLISVYPGETEASFQAEPSEMRQFDLPDGALLRFWRMQEHNFRYGLQALERRQAILDKDTTSTPIERAQARVAVADWHQWHRRYAPAIKLYEEAWAIAEEQVDATEWLATTLTEPLELPRTSVFTPGAVPLGIENDAEIAIRFDVSRHGEAKEITILSEQTRETQASITRAYHYLRNVRFRPRLDAGTVVRAEEVERRYQIRY